MKRSMIAALIALALMGAISGAATASIGSATSTNGSRTYYDAVGEDEDDLPPDISSVTVTRSGGSVTFRVGVANLGPGLISGDFLVVFIDTDRNEATGCDGNELALAVLGSTGGNDVALLGRCVAGDISFTVSQSSFSYGLIEGAGLEGPGAVVFRVSGGIGASFKFEVGSEYEGSYDDYFDSAGPWVFTDGGSSAPVTRPAPSRPAPVGISIQPHANVRAEATGPTGARVTFRPARVRGAKSVRYSHRSGSMFRLGKTVVKVTARNGTRTVRSNFAVFVTDTTKPKFTPLASVTTSSANPTSTTVAYGPVVATDRVDRTVTVTCTPPSGGLFVPGATNVACSARDDSGNTATATIRAVVPVFTSAIGVHTITTYQRSTTGQVTGMSTAIALTVPNPEGDAPTYTWTATSGTIMPNGPSASWARGLIGNEAAPGTVTVTITHASGAVETHVINLP